jgi:glycine hydroxymethyltransferase
VATILVVCTGNICRSPIAEGFLRQRLKARGIDFDVESAGVSGLEGYPAEPESVKALLERDIDISSHTARLLKRRMVEHADLALAMSANHRDGIRRLVPEASDRTFTLKELVFLLERRGGNGFDGEPADALRSAVAAATDLREAGRSAGLVDEDIPDPLGLGQEAYRAVAWQLEGLIDRLVDGLFGPAVDPRVQRPGEGGGRTPSDEWEGLPVSGKDFAADWEELERTDPEVARAIADELLRERTTLRLIASENYASPAVLAALASTMNNKYAEGYPGRRYYGGCEFVDVTETLAIERAKQLFGAEHANVQPHAGAQANMAVYGAFLEPRNPDFKVLGMVLAHGGHLTHGSPVNFSGKWFSFVGYEVERESETIDMDRVRDLALEHRPRIVLAGFTAYPRAIDFAAFRQIADEVGAILMVDAAHFIGLVAGGAYPSPVPHADVVTFTTHKTLRGPRGAMILSRAEHAKAIDKAVFPMMQGGPLEHVIAAKAVCLREAMQPEFGDYADRTVRAARALANGLAEEGLRLVSGGTDSHLALVDLQPIGMTGADAERLCDDVGIALNKNAIPFDPLPPAKASGIRVGTPGPATLGMDEPEMKEVARLIGDVLRNPADDGVKKRARSSVLDLMARFPAYPG